MVPIRNRPEKSRRLRSIRPVMAHEIAKLLLEHADTFLERTEAVKSALAMGMPLSDIEEYLDWVDLIRSQSAPSQQPKAAPPKPPQSGESK